MEITLEEPFSSLYRKGYLRVSNKDKRKRVDLFNSNSDRTTISYARYIMCLSLGYVLSDDFEVDHIDCDETNDLVSNLQVLTIEEHRKKTKEEFSIGRSGVNLICECCGKSFFRESRYINNSKVWQVCSRSCHGKLSILNSSSGKRRIKVTDEIKTLIIELRSQGFSDYKIAPIVNLTRAKVQRYRKEESIP